MPTTVTAEAADQPKESVVIDNNYVLIVDGTAYRHSVTLHNLKDGTQTHVIVIKGIKP